MVIKEKLFHQYLKVFMRTANQINRHPTVYIPGSNHKIFVCHKDDIDLHHGKICLEKSRINHSIRFLCSSKRF